MSGSLSGPFDSSAEAFTAALEAAGIDDGVIPAAMTPAGNRELLSRALGESGVVLGAFDERIVEWLGRWEPSTCAVIAGFVTRAYEAGRQQP